MPIIKSSRLCCWLPNWSFRSWISVCWRLGAVRLEPTPVRIASLPRAGRSGILTSVRARYFPLLLTHILNSSGAHLTYYSMGTGLVSLRVKQTSFLALKLIVSGAILLLTLYPVVLWTRTNLCLWECEIMTECCDAILRITAIFVLFNRNMYSARCGKWDKSASVM